MSKRMVSIGDLVVDLLMEARLPLAADDHQMSPALKYEAGGACSTILAARNMGLQAAALGAVGDDWQGRMLCEILRGADVDISALESSASSVTTTVITLTDRRQGGHVFLGHYGQGPTISLTEKARRLLMTADALFMSGYSLVDDRLRPLVESLLDFLEDHKRPLYVDVGPLMGQLNSARLERILRLTDTLLLTEAEIPLVAAGETGREAGRRLIRRFPRLLMVVKQAARGCYMLTQKGEITCAGYHAPLVDAVGAGDAFAAALIWARLNRFSLEDCGKIANAMGAASVRKIGAGRNVPSRAEVQAVLDANHVGIKLC